MNFELNERQLNVIEKARDLAENYLKPGVIERDETSTFPLDGYKKLGELGLLGLPYSSEYGGSDAGYLEYVLAVEEIYRHLWKSMCEDCQTPLHWKGLSSV